MSDGFRKLCLTVAILSLLTAGCGNDESKSHLKSLTNEGFSGQKYFFGWGAAMSGDSIEMKNEARYDVLHAGNIFKEDVGGSYKSVTLFQNEARSSAITAKWQEYKSTMSQNDMYIQFSSGHGSGSGLAVGLNWKEMAKQILDLPAKETIVFTMSCYSGNFVNAINSLKQSWQNRSQEGRTLFVMTSSRAEEESSTGPGTDSQGGPTGSAGSAYGYAVWKALSGEADGAVDGIKDGYLSLEEISSYVVKRTKELGGHTPQITGTYFPGLIMNRVPNSSAPN